MALDDAGIVLFFCTVEVAEHDGQLLPLVKQESSSRLAGRSASARRDDALLPRRLNCTAWRMQWWNVAAPGTLMDDMKVATRVGSYAVRSEDVHRNIWSRG
jgi:hypothetical protein